MKKLRLCLTCIALALMMIVCSVGASAAYNLGIGGLFEFVLLDGYYCQGSSDITVTEVVHAISEYLGMPTDEVAKYLEFHVVDDKKCIEVYEDDELVEVVYKDESGAICGYATGFNITFENGSVEQVAANISAGLNTGFAIGTSAFNFLMVNPLSSTVIGISFCGVALFIIKRALRVSRRM